MIVESHLKARLLSAIKFDQESTKKLLHGALLIIRPLITVAFFSQFGWSDFCFSTSLLEFQSSFCYYQQMRLIKINTQSFFMTIESHLKARLLLAIKLDQESTRKLLHGALLIIRPLTNSSKTCFCCFFSGAYVSSPDSYHDLIIHYC